MNGSKGKLSVGAWVLLSMAMIAPSISAADEPVSSRLEAYRVVQADGSEKLEPAKQVNPGDMIEYQVIYENAEEKPISNLQVNFKVLEGTSYVDGSAKASADADVRFSVDGGKTFREPPIKRKRTDGSEETVPPSEYSNLQWLAKTPLSKGSAQKYSYRVRVADAR